jgi:hypothetical protein
MNMVSFLIAIKANLSRNKKPTLGKTSPGKEIFPANTGEKTGPGRNISKSIASGANYP